MTDQNEAANAATQGALAIPAAIQAAPFRLGALAFVLIRDAQLLTAVAPEIDG